MREILFRGKCAATGKWAQGNYYNDEKNVYISYNHKSALGDFGSRNQPVNNVIVIPETVGQYTGLTDKNGKRIYEGDIVRIGNEVHCVKYTINEFAFIPVCNAYTQLMVNSYESIKSIAEVIGNIHDNPELLEDAIK